MELKLVAFQSPIHILQETKTVKNHRVQLTECEMDFLAIENKQGYVGVFASNGDVAIVPCNSDRQKLRAHTYKVSNGYIIIPVEVRKELGIEDGLKLFPFRIAKGRCLLLSKRYKEKHCEGCGTSEKLATPYGPCLDCLKEMLTGFQSMQRQLSAYSHMVDYNIEMVQSIINMNISDTGFGYDQTNFEETEIK